MKQNRWTVTIDRDSDIRSVNSEDDDPDLIMPEGWERIDLCPESELEDALQEIYDLQSEIYNLEAQMETMHDSE